MHPNLKKHVSLLKPPKPPRKWAAWAYRFADKKGQYCQRVIDMTVVCFKDAIQVPAHEPDGIPFYFVALACSSSYGVLGILMNKPDVYFLADSSGDFIVTATRRLVQDLGDGDQKIINAALRRFRRHVRRGTKAWGCPICNRTGVSLYDDEFICRLNGGPCA